MDGAPFEVSADDVSAAFHGQTPTEPRRYWIEVDGIRWPVKQVLSILTGAPPSRFRSSDARRHLCKLGFTIGNLDDTAPSDLPASNARQRRFDWSALAKLDSVTISTSFTWHRAGAITLEPSDIPLFPALPQQPGLYRIQLITDNVRMRIFYIGESKDVRGRARQHRNATVDRVRSLTSRRVHQVMVEHLTAGGEITMDIALEAQLGDGSLANLRRKSGRLLAESAAIVLAQLDPTVRLLNLDAQPGTED